MRRLLRCNCRARGSPIITDATRHGSRSSLETVIPLRIYRGFGAVNAPKPHPRTKELFTTTTGLTTDRIQRLRQDHCAWRVRDVCPEVRCYCLRRRSRFPAGLAYPCTLWCRIAKYSASAASPASSPSSAASHRGASSSARRAAARRSRSCRSSSCSPLCELVSTSARSEAPRRCSEARSRGHPRACRRASSRSGAVCEPNRNATASPLRSIISKRRSTLQVASTGVCACYWPKRGNDLSVLRRTPYATRFVHSARLVVLVVLYVFLDVSPGR